MYIEAKLVFQHYVPYEYNDLLFLSVNSMGEPFVYMVDKLTNPEEYMELNGFPVKPFIIQEGNPNIPDSDIILAEPDEIGWMDDGEHADSLRDIELIDYNTIIQKYNGYCLIDVNEDEEDGNEYVLLYEGQATIALYDAYDDDEEQEDELNALNDENDEED